MTNFSKLLVACILFAATFSSAQPVIGITTFFTNTTTALVANTSCTSTKTVSLNGWLFSVSSTSNCGFNQTNSTGGDGRLQYLVGFGTLTQATFGSDDGSEFALQSLTWGVSTASWTSKSMSFVGYKNGMPVPGATLNATTPAGTGLTNTTVVTFTGNPAFSDVDDIVLAPNSTTCNTILFFEDITVATSTAACSSPTLSLAASSNVQCFGQSNGSATMSAVGGSGFTYTWSPSGGNAAAATGLAAGVYTLSCRNSSCVNISTQTVLITQPAALTSNTAVTNALCNGASGSATITASGGIAPYSYAWSSGATTSVVANLAGAYSATITDANNCTSLNNLSISQPPALLANTTATTALCFGGNGNAAAIASGGTGAYTYSWSSGTTTSLITNVAGTYTVTVTDANNCLITRTVTIAQPPALLTNTSVANVLCYGGNGTATITASGGTGAYAYTWSTGANTATLTALAGVYSATVTDANNCSNTLAINIAQPTVLLTNTAVTNVLCNGGNGTATITASGGTGSYTYAWSNAATTSVITNMAGVYTSTVTDANNCVSTNTVTIMQPSALITNTAVTNVLCHGGAGTASINASGGTGAYSYAWSNSATTSFITALAGVYTATVTDANNCTSIKNISITQPAALSTSVLVTHAPCFGSVGSSTIAASGGTGAYTYSWSNGSTTSSLSQPAGVYTATVTDANNCTSIATATITQPSALTTNTAVTNVLCNGGLGTATVTASGGTGAYTYSWSSGATSAVLTALAGAYTATVTDANACTSTNSLVITQPSALSVTAAASAPSVCAGSPCTLTASGSGGAGFFNYSWSTGLSGSAIVVTPSVTTVYTVTLTDANNCVTSKTLALAVGSLPTITLNSATICSGQSHLFIPSGGASYSYTFSPFVTPTVTTTYSIIGVGANLCTVYATATVTVYPNPTITVPGYTICSGQTITLTPSGAHTYTFTNGTTTISPVVSPTVTTTYGIAGTSIEGCQMPGQVPRQVVVKSATISVSGGTLCSGNSFTLNPTGGTSYTFSGGSQVVSPTVTTSYSVVGTGTTGCVSPPVVAEVTVLASPSVTLNGGSVCPGYSYTLNPQGASTYTYLNGGPVVTPVATTVYSVMGTSAQGCLASNVSTALVTVTNTLTINIAGTDVICSGQTTTLTASGASTYSWSTNASTPTVSLNPNVNTTYTVFGFDASCDNSAVVTVTVKPSPTLSISGPTSVCEGETITLTASGAAAYVWEDASTSNSISVSPTVSSNYAVTGTASNNCSSTSVYSLTVHPKPTISVLSSNTLICVGETASLTASGANSYTWNTGSNAPLIVITPTAFSTYTVIGMSPQACMDTVSFSLDVTECTGIYSSENKKTETLRVYPNPSIGLFTLETEIPALLLIRNTLGELVQKKDIEAGKHQIDLQTEARGLYYLEITSKGQRLALVKMMLE